MRTLIEISDKQINDPAIICKAQNVSRAEIISRAIQAYLKKKHRPNVLLDFGKSGELMGWHIKKRFVQNGKGTFQ